MKGAHSDTFPFPCKFCKEKYAFNYDLNKHMKKAHPDKVKLSLPKGPQMVIPPGFRVPGVKFNVARPGSNPLFTISTEAGVVHLFTEDMDVKPNIEELVS